MPTFFPSVQFFIAALIGAGHAFVAVFLWAFLAVDNPINDWLLEALDQQGHHVAYRVAIYGYDLAVNVLLAIPFVVVIAYLMPRRSWSYLWVALIVSLCLLNWSLFTDPENFATVLGFPSFYLGQLVMGISLPLGFAAVIKHGQIANAA